MKFKIGDKVYDKEQRWTPFGVVVELNPERGFQYLGRFETLPQEQEYEVHWKMFNDGEGVILAGKGGALAE